MMFINKYTWQDRKNITYDKNGNIKKVTDTDNGVTVYTYDAENQVKTKKLPNRAQSSYTYDRNGRLIKREETSSGGNRESYRYEYDKNGNRTKETKLSSGITETIHYAYDALDQLVRVTDKREREPIRLTNLITVRKSRKPVRRRFSTHIITGIN